MEWIVLDVLGLPQDHKALILECGGVRVIAYVNTDLEIKCCDILSPVKDAFYTINHQRDKRIIFLSASKFTPERWRIMST